jgi:hypothetical protein
MLTYASYTRHMRKAPKKNAAAAELARLRAKKLSPARRKEIAMKGVQARLAKVGSEQRSAIARKAAAARWAKKGV